MKAEDHGAIIGMDSKHKNKDHYIKLHYANHNELILFFDGQSSISQV